MDTDAERIERLRELWAKYRFHLVCGLAMTLAAVGGFSWENLHRQAERRAANEQLFRVLLAARDDRVEEAESAFAELESDSYPDLRNLGAFAIADLRFQEENAEGAEEALREIMDNSEDDGLRDLAALRLAEVLTRQERYADAETLLSQRVPNQGSARILFQDRLGDAAALRGDAEAALAAYRQAENQARRDFPNYLPLLEFKIGALLAGGAPAAESAPPPDGESGLELEAASGDGAAAEADGDAAADAEAGGELKVELNSETGDGSQLEDSQ